MENEVPSDNNQSTSTIGVGDIVVSEKEGDKKVGRPLKFESEEEIAKRINEYFNETPKEEWTITGLALSLDTSRKVLCEYEDKDEFSNTIKKAKLKVENGYEIDLKKHGRTGTIFALKNFDWKDKSEVDNNIKGTLSLSKLLEKADE